MLDIMQWFLMLPILSQLIIIYLIIINIITFFYFGIDKIKAHWNKRRIPETILWGLALFGGSIGALVGMNFFRHKTKKISFQSGIAIIIIVQIFLLYIFI